MARHRIVLDSGALAYLADKDGALRATIREALSRRAAVVVPTAVIAEVATGDRRLDANMNRALEKTDTVALDVRVARSAAVLRHAYRQVGAGTVDAVVVATADAVPGSCILTGDPVDLGLLASVRGRTRIVSLSEMA